MIFKITKHQAALLNKRQATLAAAQQALAAAEREVATQNQSALDVIAQIAADAGTDELNIERFQVESKGDAHTLILVEKMTPTTRAAG